MDVYVHIKSLSESLTDILLFGYRIAYLEFKTEAIAEKAMEEAQGTEVQGRSIMVDFTGEKSQKGGRGELSDCVGVLSSLALDLLWMNLIMNVNGTLVFYSFSPSSSKQSPCCKQPSVQC